MLFLANTLDYITQINNEIIKSFYAFTLRQLRQFEKIDRF